MAAPTQVGSPTTAVAGASPTITVAAPTGIVVGDYLIAVYRHQSSASVVDVTPPTGWTRLSAPFVANSSSGRIMGIFGKVATGSEPADYLWTTPHNQRQVIAIQRWQNVDLTSPVAGYSSPYAGNTLTNGRIAPSFVSAVAEATVIFLGAGDFTDGQTHVPSVIPTGFTATSNIQTGTGTTGSRTILWTGYKVATGTIPDQSITWPAAPTVGAQMIALVGDDRVGSASGAYTFAAGSATGSRDSEGSASGGFAFTGTAAGSRDSSGSASGAYNFAGTASGSLDVSGTASGGYAFTGTATGSRDSVGSAGGGYTFTGGPAFAALDVSGIASGAYTFTGGTASGSRDSTGTAVGAYAFTGAATASTDAVGTASGECVWDGVATGSRASAGVAGGSWDYTGGPVIVRPPNGWPAVPATRTLRATAPRTLRGGTSRTLKGAS